MKTSGWRNATSWPMRPRGSPAACPPALRSPFSAACSSRHPAGRRASASPSPGSTTRPRPASSSTRRSAIPAGCWSRAGCWPRSPAPCRPSRSTSTLTGRGLRSSPATPVHPADDAGRGLPAAAADARLAGTVDSAVFAEAVAQTAVAAGRDDTLPMLTGIRVEIDGPRLTLAATDRFRLAVRELDWTPDVAEHVHRGARPGPHPGRRREDPGRGGAVTIALGDGLLGLGGGRPPPRACSTSSSRSTARCSRPRTPRAATSRSPSWSTRSSASRWSPTAAPRSGCSSPRTGCASTAGGDDEGRAEEELPCESGRRDADDRVQPEYLLDGLACCTSTRPARRSPRPPGPRSSGRVPPPPAEGDAAAGRAGAGLPASADARPHLQLARSACTSPTCRSSTSVGSARSTRAEPGPRPVVGANGQEDQPRRGPGLPRDAGQPSGLRRRPLIRRGAERAVVRGAGRCDERPRCRSRSRSARAGPTGPGQRRPSRPRDMLGILRTVLFAPEDLALVAATRRSAAVSSTSCSSPATPRWPACAPTTTACSSSAGPAQVGRRAPGAVATCAPSTSGTAIWPLTAPRCSRRGSRSSRRCARTRPRLRRVAPMAGSHADRP